MESMDSSPFVIRIMAIGDVVGDCGVEAIEVYLRKLKLEYDAEVIIVNGENSSERGGIDRKAAQRLFDAGADIITGGNHSFRNRDIYSELDENKMLLRPQNYGGTSPGSGYVIINTSAGRLLVVNLAGQLFMEAADSPFAAAERLLKELEGQYDFAVADFHAEATSEKAVFARHFDGRLQAVFGTHTHVQTADNRILQGGCAFISDIGMCGADDSILGVKSEAVMSRMIYLKPERFVNADGLARIDGAIFTIDTKLKCATKIERFSIFAE